MTDTTAAPETPAPEPWSVWGNPYNGYFVWHEPTGKWLPVANDMAEAVDPGHAAAQNLHQLSAYHGVVCTQDAPAKPTTGRVDMSIEQFTQIGEELIARREALADGIQQLQQLIIQTAIACATCLAEERQQARPGHNIANAIIDGTGYCNEHLDVHGGRLVPRKSSGLIVTGG